MNTLATQVITFRRPKVTASARRRAFAWVMIVTTGIIDMLWARASGFSLNLTGLMLHRDSLILCVATATVLCAASRIRRYQAASDWLRLNEVAEVSAWFAALSAFTVVRGVLAYLSVAANAPLIDSSLLAFDSALGFD